MEWKEIPGHEGSYKVSTCGSVMSVDRVVDIHKDGLKPYSAKIRGKTLKPIQLKSNGRVVRLAVFLRKDGRYIHYGIHNLVLSAFVGARPDGYFGCHKDGDPTNNHLDNLYWGTPKENSADMLRHGTRLMGESIPWSRLKDDDIKFIRNNADKMTQQAMADILGTTQSRISRILSGEQWKHI